MGITIYGQSDDLIEIDGDVYEEFQYSGPDGDLIALSNGAIFRVEFTRDGWRITPIFVPREVIWDRHELVPPDGNDEVTVEDVVWVVHGDAYALERTRDACPRRHPSQGKRR